MAQLRVLTLLLLWHGVAPVSVFAVDPAVLAAQQQRIDLVERIAPAVVAIFAGDGQGGGSGVLVSADGYTVTNFHVVEGSGPFMKCGLNDGRIYHAVRVGLDPTGDLAVIKLLGRDDFPFAHLADSDDVRIGDPAYALGNPFLLANDFRPTVTFGMVSGTHRYQYPANTFLEYTDCIQVDTSINPGNSGGPLFNDQGDVIGINGRISVEKRGRVNVGAGYSISSNQVRHFLDHLKSGRIVDHATLGATVTTRDDGAVIVSNILEQSEAYRRGLRDGDELVTFAGRPLRSVNQFKNILGIYPKGWKLPLTYRRDGQKHDIVVRLRALHRAAELMPGPPQGSPDGGPKRPRPGEPDPQPAPPDDIPPESPEPPGDRAPPDSAAPAEYASLYVEKAGYANYYFNLAERTRVLASLEALGSFDGLSGLWQLSGTTDDARPFQFKLSPEAAAVKIGSAVSIQPVEQGFSDQPPGSGGLLGAMHFLRMLLVDPEAYFSEFYYVGSEPLDGLGETVDVLATTRGQTTARWYFSRGNGRCVGFDTAIAEDFDDCEVRIINTRDFGGRSFPAEFTVRHADQPFATFRLEKAGFE